MVQTVEQNFGARIDYWAVTSFWGITRMVDTVGGLQVRIPFRMQDRFSGSNFHPGLQRLRGPDVLAFARDRKSVPGGDFGRQENGGRVFVSALVQFQREFRQNPGRLLAWIAAGVRNMDTDLPVDELVDLAFAASGIRFANVRNVVLPGGTGNVGRALRSAAVDGDGARDLRRREGGRGIAAGQHPAQPDRYRVGRSRVVDTLGPLPLPDDPLW